MPSYYPSSPDFVTDKITAALSPALRAWLDTHDPQEVEYFANTGRDAPEQTRRYRTLYRHVDHAVEWVEAEPTETFTITFADRNARRPFLVMKGADGVRRAYYRSTGLSGGSYDGDWIPFHGFVNRGRTEELPWVWLVKEGKEKMPDPETQPDAYRAFYTLRWAERAGLIDHGIERIVPDYTASLGNLKEAYEMLGEANRWLRAKGALPADNRWRRPYPDQPENPQYNAPFPYIGIDLHFPTSELRAWAKREGMRGADAMRHDPVDALVKAGVLPATAYRRRRNPRVS